MGAMYQLAGFQHLQGELVHLEGPMARTPAAEDAAQVDTRCQLAVLQAGEPREDDGLLVAAADAHARDLARLLALDRLPLEEDLPFGGRRLAGEQVDQGTLARPVGAENGVDLALAKREVDVVDRHQAAEAAGQAPGLQQGTVRW